MPTPRKKTITLVPKKDKGGLQKYEDLKGKLVSVREAEKAAKEKLSELNEELEKSEAAVKYINAANRILADMYGTSQTLVSLNALRGANFEESDSPSAVRAKVVAYFYKSKNITPKFALNSNDVATLHKAVKLCLLFAEYDPKVLEKAAAETRALRDKLELQIRVETKTGSSNALRSRVQHVGLDPLAASKNIKQAAQDVAKEITKIDGLMSVFLDDIVKLRTLQSLQKRGVNIDDIKRQVADAKLQLSELESKRVELLSQQKNFEKSNSKVSKSHDNWYQKQVDKIKTKFASDKKRIKIELAKLDQAAKNRLDVNQGRLGLSGIVDKTRLISEVEMKLAALKSTIQKLLLQESSFSVNLNNKGFSEREKELRDYIQQGKGLKRIQKNDPQYRVAQQMSNADAWLPAVKETFSNKKKMSSFPSLSVNAINAITDKKNRIQIPVQNIQLTEYIKKLLILGAESAEAWLRKNFDTKGRELCLGALLSISNPTSLEGVKRINAVVNEAFEQASAYMMSQQVIPKLLVDIKMNAKNRKTGVVLNRSPEKIANDIAVQVVKVTTSPNSKLLSQVRQRTLLAFRQQLHEWVSRNIRFEDQ